MTDHPEARDARIMQGLACAAAVVLGVLVIRAFGSFGAAPPTPSLVGVPSSELPADLGEVDLATQEWIATVGLKVSAQPDGSVRIVSDRMDPTAPGCVVVDGGARVTPAKAKDGYLLTETMTTTPECFPELAAAKGAAGPRQ